jgi:hypothetical protein
MKLRVFKCHAVMPRCRVQGVHAIKTYFVTAPCVDTARSRVLDETKDAEFVTMPVAMTESSAYLRPDILMTDTATISARELRDLQAAHQWNAGED